MNDLRIKHNVLRHFQENMDTPFVHVCSDRTCPEVYNGMDDGDVDVYEELSSLYDLLEGIVGKVQLASEVFSFCSADTGNLLYGKPWTYEDSNVEEV